MPRFLAGALASFLALNLSACAANQAASTDGEQARVEVENRSSVDMDIYVRPLRGGANRLGFAPAGETTSFSLSRAMLTGAGPIRLEARPTGDRGSPVLSDTFYPSSDDVIEWSIPPQ